MNITLCGIDIPYEKNYAVKGAGNRVHNNCHNDIQSWTNDDDVAGNLLSIIQDCQGILRSTDTGKPLDLNKKLIDRVVVRRELSTLSEDVKIFKEAISNKFNLAPENDKRISVWGKVISCNEQCAILDDIAKKLISSSMSYVVTKQELFLLSGSREIKSILNTIPEDLVKVILNKCFDIELEKN